MKAKAIGGTLTLTLLLGTFFCLGNGMGMVGRAAQPIAETSDPHSCCTGADASDPGGEEAAHACCFALPGRPGSIIAMPGAPLGFLAALAGDSVFMAPEQPLRVMRVSRAPPETISPFSSPTASRAPPVA